MVHLLEGVYTVNRVSTIRGEVHPPVRDRDRPIGSLAPIAALYCNYPHKRGSSSMIFLGPVLTPFWPVPRKASIARSPDVMTGCGEPCTLFPLSAVLGSRWL